MVFCFNPIIVWELWLSEDVPVPLAAKLMRVWRPNWRPWIVLRFQWTRESMRAILRQTVVPFRVSRLPSDPALHGQAPNPWREAWWCLLMKMNESLVNHYPLIAPLIVFLFSKSNGADHNLALWRLQRFRSWDRYIASERAWDRWIIIRETSDVEVMLHLK